MRTVDLYLGYNANFVLRVATDRDWQADVREQKFWVDDLDKQHKVKHHLYRGEGVFYGLYQVGVNKILHAVIILSLYFGPKSRL